MIVLPSQEQMAYSLEKASFGQHLLKDSLLNTVAYRSEVSHYGFFHSSVTEGMVLGLNNSQLAIPPILDPSPSSLLNSLHKLSRDGSTDLESTPKQHNFGTFVLSQD